jgi:hypothetical protein|tara:strand:- start:3004 stop:3453 length:450 start_codon:yes stop_codon:yes gene_type:complete
MPDLISTDAALNPEASAFIMLLLGLMIPAEGEMPSAADPAIAQKCLQGMSSAESLVMDALYFINDQGVDFEKLSPTEQLRLIDTLRASKPEFIAAFQFNAVASYYADERVLTVLGLEGRAPHPGGYKAPETDWRLLEAVTERGSIYRKV